MTAALIVAITLLSVAAGVFVAALVFTDHGDEYAVAIVAMGLLTITALVAAGIHADEFFDRPSCAPTAERAP